MTVESTGPPATVNASEFTIRVAREVTAQIAPAESGVFDDVASTWRAGVAAGRAPGSAIGFGIEAALVSAIVIDVIAGSIVEVLGIGIGATRSRWRRWRARRRTTTDSELAVADVPAIDGKIVMTAAQAIRLREVSRRHATTIGLPEATANLLADAIVGAVHVPDVQTSSDDGHS